MSFENVVLYRGAEYIKRGLAYPGPLGGTKKTSDYSNSTHFTLTSTKTSNMLFFTNIDYKNQIALSNIQNFKAIVKILKY